MLTHNHRPMRVAAGTLLCGCLLLAPAAWAQSSSTPAATGPTNTTIYTSSTRTIDHDTTVNVTRQVSTFLVELKARMQGGAYLSDQTYNVAFADPTVQTAITQAESLLTTAGAVSFTGPTRLSSTQSTSSATSTGPYVVTGTNVSFSTTLYIGPKTIMIGDNQSQSLAIAPGQQDYDTLVTSDVYQTQTVTRTNTTLTTQVYEIDGVASVTPPPPATPAPPALLLALTGIAAAGLYAARRRLRRGVLQGRDSPGRES